MNDFVQEEQKMWGGRPELVPNITESSRPRHLHPSDFVKSEKVQQGADHEDRR